MSATINSPHKPRRKRMTDLDKGQLMSAGNVSGSISPVSYSPVGPSTATNGSALLTPLRLLRMRRTQ
jgi:hypothetical protein